MLQQGKVVEAQRYFIDILEKNFSCDEEIRDEARLGLAIISLYTGNFAECERELHLCIADFRRKHSGFALLSALQTIIEYYLETEIYGHAFALIDEALTILSRSPNSLMETTFRLYQIILLCREKLPHKARELLSNLEQQKAEELYFNLTDALYEAKAELAVAEGAQSAAQFFFEEAASHASKYNPVIEMMYLHRAAAACSECTTKSKLLHEKSLAIAKRLQLDVRADLFQKKFKTEPPPVITEKLVLIPTSPLIKIFGLGQLAVFHPGEHVPITKHDWRSEKSRKLLLYLLLKEPHQRTKTLITNVLWKDSSEVKKQSNLFHTTLSQLRKTLNDPDFIYNDDSTYSVRVEKYWTDWEEFEQCIQLGIDAEKKGDTPSAISSFKQAKQLYKGEFASGFDDEWIEDKRQQLWTKCEQLINHLAGLMEEEGSFEPALDLVEEWITLMPENDLPYQTAIRLAARLGDTCKATRYYDACRQMLRDEYGLKPSKALEDAYLRYVINP